MSAVPRRDDFVDFILSFLRIVRSDIFFFFFFFFRFVFILNVKFSGHEIGKQTQLRTNERIVVCNDVWKQGILSRKRRSCIFAKRIFGKLSISRQEEAYNIIILLLMNEYKREWNENFDQWRWNWKDISRLDLEDDFSIFAKLISKN